MDALQTAPARPQVPLSSKPFHVWTMNDGAVWTEFHRVDGGYLLRFPDLADFRIHADDKVSCVPTPQTSPSTQQHLYLNQVLPLVQSRQGKLVFHASAVEVGDAAVVFVGESGRGKSTLAASFATSGHRFLTDDGLVIEECSTGFEVLSSHPSIRLWDDSREALIAPDTVMAPAVHYTSKARFLAGGDIAFCPAPRPLRRVYFLGDGDVDEVSIQPLRPAEAMVEWVKHSFLLGVEERSHLASHFDQVARLARQPIHYRLDYPRCYDELASLRRVIVEHAREGGGPA